MPKSSDSVSLPVQVSIRQPQSTPAQRAAWRRLWQILLEDEGARPETSADQASDQQEGLADQTAT